MPNYRFLVFEFTWNIMMFDKQVEMVNEFRNTVAEDGSMVRQLIMGSGKTTVRITRSFAPFASHHSSSMCGSPCHTFARVPARGMLHLSHRQTPPAHTHTHTLTHIHTHTHHHRLIHSRMRAYTHARACAHTHTHTHTHTRAHTHTHTGDCTATLPDAGRQGAPCGRSRTTSTSRVLALHSQNVVFVDSAEARVHVCV